MNAITDYVVLGMAVLGWALMVYYALAFLDAATKFLKAKTGPQINYNLYDPTKEQVEAAKRGEWLRR